MEGVAHLVGQRLLAIGRNRRAFCACIAAGRTLLARGEETASAAPAGPIWTCRYIADNPGRTAADHRQVSGGRRRAGGNRDHSERPQLQRKIQNPGEQRRPISWPPSRSPRSAKFRRRESAQWSSSSPSKTACSSNPARSWDCGPARPRSAIARVNSFAIAPGRRLGAHEAAYAQKERARANHQRAGKFGSHHPLRQSSQLWVGLGRQNLPQHDEYPRADQ